MVRGMKTTKPQAKWLLVLAPLCAFVTTSATLAWRKGALPFSAVRAVYGATMVALLVAAAMLLWRTFRDLGGSRDRSRR
jgi:hypothetical protein